MRLAIGLIVGLGVVGTAMAHQGAQGVVKERMDAMGRVQDNTRVIGRMLRGQTEFDAEAARAALDQMAEEARRIPDYFEARDTSHPSEARALIWEDFETFAAIAENMAQAAAGPADTPEALQQTFRAVGQTCGACHEKFRAETD